MNELLVTVLGVEPGLVRSDRTLEELGLDSLALEELRTVAEERLDIDLDSTPIAASDSVGTLIASVDAARRAGAAGTL